MTPETPSAFPAATREDWLRLIGGTAGFDKLRARTLDGIVVEPIPSAPASFGLAPLRGRAEISRWDMRPLIAEDDPAAARRAIAEELADGATSIALKLATPGDFGLPARYDAIAEALADVPLDRIEVCLLPGDQYFGAAQSLMSLWDRTGHPAAGLRLGLNADPLGALARTGALEAGLWSSLELLGQFVATNMAVWPRARLLLADSALYHDAGASEAQELAAMLASVLEYIRVLDFEGKSAAEVLPHLTVSLAADADLFPSIAKLRAARLLLGRLAESLGGADASAVRLWVLTSQRMLTERAPHTNVLRNAIAALGAATAGADVLTVRPHTWALGRPDTVARRLARNTHHLLAEESGLARVLDPAAGAPAIAALTEGLCERAWTLFQEIEEAGGMARALVNGKVQEGIADMVRRRAALLAEGKLAVTGVTVFADANEVLPDSAPHPPCAPILTAATRIPPLPLYRLSAAAEATVTTPGTHP